MSNAIPLLEPRPHQPFGKGLVELYTGTGKGKTTAALGVVLRAVAHGLRVHIVYLMKGDTRYGEQDILGRLPGVSFAKFGQPTFVDPKNVKEEEKEEARKALAEARRAMLSSRYDLIVLDEVNVAAAWELVAVEEVLHLIRDKPEEVELILTGRYAPAELVEAADLVTEMFEVKHPFQKGIMARPGIDY